MSAWPVKTASASGVTTAYRVTKVIEVQRMGGCAAPRDWKDRRAVDEPSDP
jgi:hypothetical protein